MQQNRLGYISYLRVLATCCVLIIHASTGYLNVFDPKGFDWNYANLLHSFTRFSVPLFVMISGALLLPKQEALSTFYQKRLTRVFWPFLFWLLVYLVYYFYRYTNFEVLPLSRVLEVSLEKLLHGSSAHLWYLYMIIGLYLTIPFLQHLVQALTDKEMLVFLGIWFLSLIFLNKRLVAYTPDFDLTFFSGYVGYLILGYRLSQTSRNRGLWLWALLFVALAAVTTWGTFLLSQKAGRYDSLLYGYLFPNNALMAVCIFLFFKEGLSNSAVPAWVKMIDRYSFGVYLSHIIILNYVHPKIDLPTLWKIPVVTCVTLLLSILLTYLIRKIPFGKYVSG